jgi:hypothetical protein
MGGSWVYPSQRTQGEHRFRRSSEIRMHTTYKTPAQATSVYASVCNTRAKRKQSGIRKMVSKMDEEAATSID